LLRVTLYGLYKVWNQIGAALQHYVDLRPCRLHRLVLRDQVILHANVLAKQRQDNYNQHCYHDQALTHFFLLIALRGNNLA
jgi:hypothetical protein